MSAEETSIRGEQSKICMHCQEIVWASFLPNGGGAVRLPNGQAIEESYEWREKYKVGFRRDIIARAEVCEFCSFIVRMLRKQDPLTRFDGQPFPLTISKEAIGKVLEDSRAKPHHSMAGTNWRIARFRIGSGAAVVGSSSSGKRQHKSTATLAGRRRSSRCDYSVFRGWLAICDNHHECSSVSIGPVTWEGSFRLIDVQNRCLKSFTKGDSFGLYFALSYVWGDCSKDHNLTKANIDRYHKPGGIGSLPKTIEDAICFVRSMGNGYLWVDALCIIQDDPADYAVQIPHMAAVYGGAYATIIAAAGGSADAGLPGVTVARSHVLSAEVGAFSVIESTAPVFPYHGGPIVRTIWNTRGWTFQEYLLSRRSIIFLADQVCWTCRGAEFLEEMDFDSPGVGFRWCNAGGLSESVTAPSLENYGYLMENYTKRHLMNPHDIFDAFAGIMEEIPGEFFWGLPVTGFGVYLAWSKPGYVNPHQEPRLVWRGFKDCPSWSWMAWRCDGRGVSMNYDGSAPESLVGCYRFDGKKLVLLSKPTKTKFNMGNAALHKVRQYTVWSPAQSYTCALEEVPEAVQLTNNHVVFKMLIVHKEGNQYALLGTHGWGDLHLMELEWENGVAKRTGLVSWNGTDFLEDLTRLERKIIVLG